MAWTGKFVFFIDKEYSRQGQIVEQVSDEIVLVRFDHGCGMPPSLTAIEVKSMVHTTASKPGDESCEIFETRDDLDAFVEWLDTPSGAGDETADIATVN